MANYMFDLGMELFIVIDITFVHSNIAFFNFESLDVFKLKIVQHSNRIQKYLSYKSYEDEYVSIPIRSIWHTIVILAI